MSELAVLDETDLPWIGEVVDTVARSAGQPWRIALERLARTELPARRLAAVIGAVRRLLGGPGRHAALARRARALVLGRPALEPAARVARIAEAADQLGVTALALEAALWADLPGERPVELPDGPPSELEVAAFGNVQLIQRALARAQVVALRITGDAGPLIRAAALRGLLATASREASGQTVLEIIGPLALVHRTAVYGRALAGLVPLLATVDAFELGIQATSEGHAITRTLASPVMLPIVARPPACEPAAAVKLARALARLAPELEVVRSPATLAAGPALVCPDLAFAGRHLEVVGFWTADYLAAKIAHYHAAGIAEPILCIDDTRGCAGDEPPSGARIVRFRRRIDPREVLACVK